MLPKFLGHFLYYNIFRKRALRSQSNVIEEREKFRFVRQSKSGAAIARQSSFGGCRQIWHEIRSQMQARKCIVTIRIRYQCMYLFLGVCVLNIKFIQKTQKKGFRFVFMPNVLRVPYRQYYISISVHRYLIQLFYHHIHSCNSYYQSSYKARFGIDIQRNLSKVPISTRFSD